MDKEDIGNSSNRNNQVHHGTILSSNILSLIINEIGYHEESAGCTVNAISPALIIADKTDVRQDRVRHKVKETVDKHKSVFEIQLDESISGCWKTEMKSVKGA